MKQLIYVMDPMCSWCWAFKPELQKLQSKYPELPINYVMGGLAADSQTDMPLPMQNSIKSIWLSIEARTGVPFNHDFWHKCEPRRSTYPACRAVICSEKLQAGSSSKMISAIQHAYYQAALNPSDDDVLINLANKMGLDATLFQKELNSPITQQELNIQIKKGKELGAQGFPALFLQQGEKIETISLGYSDGDSLINKAEKIFKEK